MNSIPLIIQAAKSANVRLATLLYQSANISVIPVKTDKSPALRYWSQLQKRIAHKETIEQWHRAGLLAGVGLVLGRVSGNLVVVDCDGLDAVRAFEDRFPLLSKTYTVRTGSGKGAHFYFYSKWCPKTTRAVGLDIGNVELRSDGSYVVAPPSGHASGNRYEVLRQTHIKHVFDMGEVQAWIKSLAPRPEPTPAHTTADGVKNSTAYGRAALAGESAAVRMAPKGNRNNQLYKSALKLGSLIADGRIDRGSVESELFAAAAGLVSDEGEQSVLKTIASGINKGLESSRERFAKFA